MNPRTWMWRVALGGFAALSLAACGGGGGGDSTPDGGTATSGSAAVLQLDLLTGTVTSQTLAIAVMTPSPTRLTFRRLAGGTLTLGTVPGAVGDVPEDGRSDETQRSVTVTGFHCGVLEVTQGQWKVLSGTDPWASEPSDTLGGDSSRANDLPAFGLSWTAVQNGLAAFNARSATKLRLLTNDEWEYACRGDSQGQFSWGRSTGDDLNPVTVAQYAAVRESVAAVRGPQATGRFKPDGRYEFFRKPNAFGLYDMHGNLWEWTSDGATPEGQAMRGGSWSDNLVSARAANRQHVPASVPYGLAGVRLAIQP